MLFTKAQFIEDCLLELGIVAPGESITASDSDTVSNAKSQVEAMLLTEGLKDWHYGNGSVPDMKVRPLVYLVCNEIKGSFGLPPDKMMYYEQKAEKALSDLRRQREDYESDPVSFSNF